MTIDQHSGFSPEAHLQELDGEVVPYVEPIVPPDYLANLPAPQEVDPDQFRFDYTATEPQPSQDLVVAPEVLWAMAEADEEARKYQAKGYRPERVKELSSRGKKLARLAAAGFDISSFLPKEGTDNGPTVTFHDSESTTTPEQDRRVETLMETTGLSYDDAVRRAKK